MQGKVGESVGSALDSSIILTNETAKTATEGVKVVKSVVELAGESIKFTAETVRKIVYVVGEFNGLITYAISDKIQSSKTERDGIKQIKGDIVDSVKKIQRRWYKKKLSMEL